MFSIDSSKRIHVTRGDVCSLNISIKTSDGTNYTFRANDVVRLQVMKKRSCSTVVLSKVVKVTEETTEVTINLNSMDTTIGTVINEPVKYWYEVELNPDSNPQTIIGYDESGAKEFILYPEGVDING